MSKTKFKSIIGIAVGVAKFVLKTVMFFLVVFTVINEYLIYSDFVEEGVAVYTRLSDLNDYLIAIGFALASSFAFFAFGLAQNKPILISIDLLLSLLILFYVLLNYTPWVGEIPSDVEGYQFLLSNIRFVFYAAWAAMAVVYISVVSFKALYVFYFGVDDVSESSNQQFLKQMEEHKLQKLTELQQNAYSLEGSKLSTQEYQNGIKQLYRDKVRLHDSY